MAMVNSCLRLDVELRLDVVAKRLLVDLTEGGKRHLIDEFKTIGELEFRNSLAAEVLSQGDRL